MSEIPTDISHDQHAVRRQKLADMRAAGTDPFRAAIAPTHFSADAKALYVDGQDYAVPVTVAGRLVTFRVQGGSSFVKIQDQQGQIQLYFRKDVLGEERYGFFKKALDLGDIIGVTGTLFKTKTGEITVRVDSFTLVSKALRPLPEKFHGLSDPEQVYRQRYLDVIMNQESRARLMLRSRIVSHVRRFLEGRSFIEVETPVLEATAGGAAARPFVTHHNALNVDFFLRIATELRLKRMLVGGFDRVFEIGRIFRNEGVSRRHNPEFTMLEVYQAYSDYRGMMTLIRDLLTSLVRDIVKPADGSLKIKHSASGQEIDFGGEWREVRYKDLIKEVTGDAEWFSRSKAEKIAKAEAMGLQIHPGWEEFEITNEIFSKKIEPTLIQPTFVTHLPKELCPLAKLNAEDPSVLDVFELTIGGMEVAPAYSEQNDPDVQREMFEKQAGEEKQNIDQDFLLALEHGMPPAGGMGVGIDRLCILLTGAESIRDVILFPQLRPSGAAGAAG
ncbi:lysine--tRNA ligase [Opitutus terrae]|uniref:Lysine--tRNA ligase n=1 Tax=Opitutus terrae (strain DSM 11246 / JCM 15787 / PB90-1) TaxID=452637 RepID=B1ZMT8_OPITP|nr:lysine--tRNA ligase [Opitutus terrae]ACB75366.1 lysyl-tRNA synthetase [Opitutus terrae PB90-1]